MLAELTNYDMYTNGTFFRQSALGIGYRYRTITDLGRLYHMTSDSLLF